MLQTFTYSTGLALTGRSAACAPATATRPAAEPRRRLFTIFIVTSKLFSRGRVPLFRCRSILEGPRSSPRNHPVFLHPPRGAIRRPGRGDLGMPPSVACSTLVRALAHTMKKPPNHRPQGAFSDGCCTNGTRNFPGFREPGFGACRRLVRTSYFHREISLLLALVNTGRGRPSRSVFDSLLAKCA